MQQKFYARGEPLATLHNNSYYFFIGGFYSKTPDTPLPHRFIAQDFVDIQFSQNNDR